MQARIAHHHPDSKPASQCSLTENTRPGNCNCSRICGCYTRPTRRAPRRVRPLQPPFRPLASVGQACRSACVRVLTSDHGGRAVQALMWARCRMFGRRYPHWTPQPNGSAYVRFDAIPPASGRTFRSSWTPPGATGPAATAYGRGSSLVADGPPDRGGSESGEGTRSRSGPHRLRRTRRTRWRAQRQR
jgi:hypothetical protein